MILLESKIGAEGKITIELAQGKIVIKAYHDHKSGVVSFVAEEKADYFLDKLAEAIPGVLDDALIALIKDAVAKL